MGVGLEDLKLAGGVFLGISLIAKLALANREYNPNLERIGDLIKRIYNSLTASYKK